MPIEYDFQRVAVRSSAILTNSYVAGTTIGGTASLRSCLFYNQLLLYVAFTIGSLTSLDIKVEWSPDNGVTYYRETDEAATVAANVSTHAASAVVHEYAATGNYIIAMPVQGDKCKVSAIGNGTLTSSLLAVEALLLKNFS